MPSKCSTHAAASLEQAATVSNSRTRLSRISPKSYWYCISKRLHSSLSKQFRLYAVLPLRSSAFLCAARFAALLERHVRHVVAESLRLLRLLLLHCVLKKRQSGGEKG